MKYSKALTFEKAFQDAFGAGSIVAGAAAAAANKTVTNNKGRPLTGPLLIDVDAAGNVVDKAPCPPTNSANVTKMKADGYAFHYSGPFRNNWHTFSNVLCTLSFFHKKAFHYWGPSATIGIFSQKSSIY